jgi:hypothetical protein
VSADGTTLVVIGDGVENLSTRRSAPITAACWLWLGHTGDAFGSSRTKRDGHG